jgi:hypothetical protein
MTAKGQTRHFDRATITSGLPLLADNFRAGRHVSKVPITEAAQIERGAALISAQCHFL